ncbi:metalloregulator ArsR/SmtB family transcription factor [Bifidobacterium xylocopae]|uniref:Transcriptional regulator n=1 Tax=Bifidobacterium xylocopae TaxID=2493119 RepID=A0A366KB75_9BIFI|nr:metalloregulator ArsR/SmtB family transcription factor [Bifidobacterium xylocopae]RBP98970.1 transcriptional regulator [Bifidobacterium xylocopae]
MGTQETLSALSDPARRRILDLLQEGGLEAGAIGEHVGLQPSKLSYHLKKLKEAHLVSGRRSGNRIVYELNLTALDETILWLYRLRTGAGVERHKARARAAVKD